MSTIEYLETIWKKMLAANRVKNHYQEAQFISDAKLLAEDLDARVRRRDAKEEPPATAD